MQHDVQLHGCIERARLERKRLVQVGFSNRKQVMDTKRGGTRTADPKGRWAQFHPGTGTSDGDEDEREWAAGATAQINEPTRSRELEAVDVRAHFVGAYPGVLPYVFAVRFTPKLLHQRRVEVPIEGFISVRPRHLGCVPSVLHQSNDVAFQRRRAAPSAATAG